MNKLEQLVISTIKNEGMISVDDTVTIGVSGGVDSVVLLTILCKYREFLRLKTIKVCHVNHMIRGASAKRDADFVKALCDKLGVEFYLREVDIPKMATEMKISEEAAGHHARYEFFQEVAGKTGKIATAHNKNDNVETVIMRFMRGTGLNGICGIPYVRGNIIRPLLNCGRDMIEAYAAENNIEYMTDETNLEDEYTRNKIRHHLIPYMMQFNPNLIDSIADSIKTYNDDYDYICREVEEYRKLAGDEKIYISDFIHCPDVIQRRIIMSEYKNFVKNCQDNLAQKTIDSIVNMCHNDKRFDKVRVNDVVEAVKQENLFFFRCVSEEELPEVKMPRENCCFTLPDGSRIEVCIVDDKDVVCNETAVYVPLNEFKSLSFRTAIPGDRFLKESGMTAPLKKIWQEKGVENKPRYMLCSENKVLWVPGIAAMRLAERSGKFIKFALKED